jgi:hypothetical protein
MNATEIIALFGKASNSPELNALFSELNTLNRPSLPDDDKFVYHDWVLVRRKGVELGFSDSEYDKASPRIHWGHGKLLLTQVYFYSGFEDIKPFIGELPCGLNFADNRERVREKLIAYEATRHSYLTDTWDVSEGGYRLNVTYNEEGKSINRMACFVLEAPIQQTHTITFPPLVSITNAFGTDIHSPEFRALWQDFLSHSKMQEAIEEGTVDFTESYGVTLGLTKKNIFTSIILHSNRNEESVEWQGDMPHNLRFDDSPEVLFLKMKQPPTQQSDSVLTGYAVWSFPNYTLRILYSNLYNRILRIKLISPSL